MGMTRGDALVSVARIREMAGDPEAAHQAEDDLWLGVLTHIATGTAEDPAELASIALRTCGIRFARWYA